MADASVGDVARSIDYFSIPVSFVVCVVHALLSVYVLV